MASETPLDLSMGGYLSRKRARLGIQLQSSNERRSALLAGVNVFVNGHTTPSQRSLWQLITQHGGSFSATMSPGVTHVIASGLAQTKIAQFRKSRVHVVTPDWVLQSIQRNTLLSVAHFSVPELIDCSQPSMNTYFSPVPNAAKTESDTNHPSTKSNSDAELERVGSPCSELHPSVQTDLETVAVEQQNSSGCSAHVQVPSAPLESTPDAPSIMSKGLEIDANTSGFPRTEEELMQRLGDHRFDKQPFRNPKLPSCTLTDPDFVASFFSQSRLHFIGSWKEKFECCLIHQLRQQKPQYILANEHGHILHVDMDCFFASVSIRDRPELKEKAVVVSHSKTGTGEVSTCNYVARSFGIRSGMWMEQARTLCPDLVVIGFEFGKYAEVSEEIYKIFYSYTHDVQVLSCDEAMLEIPRDADPVAIGEQIRTEIFLATGCTASVGIGDSILFARIATRFAKPNGLFHITPDLEEPYLLKLKSIRDLPGVGPATADTLHREFGVENVEKLREVSLSQLQAVLGPAHAQALYNFARGIDRRSLVTEFKERTQIATELGWGVRFFVSEQVEHFLFKLCLEVGSRLEVADRYGLTISLRVKKRHPRAPVYPSKFLGQGWCESFSKTVNLSVATRDAAVLLSHCKSMMRSFDIPPYEIRAVGLYVSRLQTSSVSVNTINNYFATSFEKPETFADATSSHEDKMPSVSVSVEESVRESYASAAVEGLEQVSSSPHQNSLIANLPNGWDPVVFMELPEDVRNELLHQVRSEASRVASLTNTDIPQNSDSKANFSHEIGDLDLNNIDLNVLHQLPRDLRMDIQFELKRIRTLHEKTPKANLPVPSVKVVNKCHSSENSRHSMPLDSRPSLDSIRSFLQQPDDAIIVFISSLMERHWFLQVEQVLKLWRKQCKNSSAFNLALNLAQESAQALLKGQFKIDPL